MTTISRAPALLGLTVLSAALAAAPTAWSEPVPTLGPPNPWEYAVGFGTVKPDSFSFVSTASSTVYDITWDSWGGPQAIGHGLNPDGADYPPVPVKLVAFDLGTCNGQFVYRQVARLTAGEAFNESQGESTCSR